MANDFINTERELRRITNNSQPVINVENNSPRDIPEGDLRFTHLGKNLILNKKHIKLVSNYKGTKKQIDDLIFAFKVCKYVRSNAIVLANNEQTVAIGGGQTSRVDAVNQAVLQAGDNSAGGSLGSDAFFPFPDGIESAAKSGVTAIIQPGGSKRDNEVIEAADNLGITMVFTSQRHFKH